jgi:phage baseplate assembly protein W
MAKPRIEKYYNPIDLDPDVAVGIKIPLNNKQGGVFELSYTTEEQAISNLKNLLLTRKGERFMQPLFGTGIYHLLFEQNTEDLPEKLRSSITADINYWLPYIVVEDVIIIGRLDFETENPGHGLQIQLSFRVTEQGANKTITFVVLSSGELILQ